MRYKIFVLLSSILLWVPASFAQQSYLNDLNGDEQVKITFVGDSITKGVGDGTLPGDYVEIAPAAQAASGYPKRVENQLGLPAQNSGIPGEILTEQGLSRLVGVFQSSDSDIVGIMEGTNDAAAQVDSAEYRRALQRAINVAKALGKQPMLFTLPPPCCNHAGIDTFTDALSNVVKNLAAINSLVLVDVERAWRSTCNDILECSLYNLPEGLHPNSRGYDLISQTVSAALLGIDVFAEDGAAQLEDALGLDQGMVIIKPDTVAIEE